jgi:hypothetical protein
MRSLSRRRLTGSLGIAGVAIAGVAIAGRRPALAGRPLLEVYKSPWCGCCGAWVEHMQQAGFAVEVNELDDVAPLKAMLGIVPELQSCHTAVVDGYVVEGHVPAREVTRLLAERPAGTGLAVPGMPIGSPGMEQDGMREPYEVVLFAADKRSVFARY